LSCSRSKVLVEKMEKQRVLNLVWQVCGICVILDLVSDRLTSVRAMDPILLEPKEALEWGLSNR
jgi:hypothetical protein